MARKRKLDDFVSTFVDRHGKERFRFRRHGFSAYLPHPNSKEYPEAYRRALEGLQPQAKQSDGRTITDLLPLFYRSIGFKKGGAAWRATRRSILEAFREEYGGDQVADFRPKDIDAILALKMERRTIDKRTVGGTAAAKRLREQLDLLFRFAVKQEWIERNPVENAEQIEHRGTGYYRWTEEDIAAFRAHWKLGTKPRLAMELVLWTGARRNDAHCMAPPKNGRIGDTASKTGKEMDVKVAPKLQAAIDAMPAVGITTLLVTEYGKPFSVAGFGNWFKDRCRDAGLPQCSLHGLRKALARRAADLEQSQQQIKALGQWTSDSQVRTYIEGANRRRLAERALDEVVEWERRENIV